VGQTVRKKNKESQRKKNVNKSEKNVTIFGKGFILQPIF
jgi:hypothetical protein